MTVIAQFRDLDRPDRFVWLRGFAGMAERAAALEAFYGGPAWVAHRDAANATMAEWHDVLLLRPVLPGSGLPSTGPTRAPVGAARVPADVIVAQVCPLQAHGGAEAARHFDTRVAPLLQRAGADIAGRYLSEGSANTFPRLPVREGENVFVWWARFADASAHERWQQRLAADPGWRDEVLPEWRRHLTGTPEVLRLAATARSRWPA